MWSEARRPNTEVPVALQPIGTGGQRSWRKVVVIFFQKSVMEKAACFNVNAVLEGALKKPVLNQNTGLFC